MSLKVWLPLNGDLHNQGISNITATNINATIDSNGKIGKCYNFAGSGQRIKFANPIINGINSFSICTWFYITAVNGGLFGARTSGSGNGLLGFLYADKILFDDGARFTCNYNVNNLLNSWHHIVFIKTPIQKLIYIDGVLAGSQNTTAVTATIKNEITIGNDSYEKYTGNDLIGKMNDFRIYDHSLSIAEIKEISQGLVLHYKLDDTIGFTDLIARGTTWTIYNNHNNTNMPSTLIDTGNMYNGDKVYRETCTPTDNSINSIRTSLSSHGVYNWRRTFTANTKYVFWIYYKPISHSDTRCGGTASNIGGWTEIPPVEVGGGWYRVGAYRNGTVTTDKTDNIFVSFKVPSATVGNPIIIDWASPHLLEGTIEIPPYDYPSTIIQDSSGYNYNGTINGTLQAASTSARYNNCIYSANGGSNYIQTPTLNMPTDAITLNIWFKTNSTTPTSDYHMIVDSVGSSTVRQHYEMCVHKTGYFRGGLFVNGSRRADNCTSTTGCNNQWHMLTLSYDGTAVKRYFDGTMEKSTSVVITSGLYPTATLRLFKDGNSSYACIDTSLSDFRIYCTALNDDAIRQLYEVGAKIDNKGNLHTYEINENSSNKLKRSGVFYNYASEPYIQLADGSYWKLMLFHYVDKGHNLFTSSNATYNNGFGLYSRLRDINNYKYNNLYEFYVIQDDIEYRWTQTSQPTASSIAGKTVVSGYTDPVNGLAKANQSNTYIGYGSWWGACGCWTSYSTGGKTGIPGFGAHSAAGMCTEYLALYTRIDAITFQIENQNNYASDFIEI